MTAKSHPVRVAAVQIAPDLETCGGTVAKVLAAIAEAAGKGAQLVVFPETFVPWYPYFSFVHPPVLTGAEHIRLYENAVVVPGPVTDAVAAAAKRHAIVVVLGVNERDHGSLYNTQLIFDADGTLVLKRRKITPTFHERMIWGQGDGAGPDGRRHRGRPRRRARLLGALQPARALRADGAARGNPRRAVSGLDGRADLCRADGGDDPPSCARERLLRRQRDRAGSPKSRSRKISPDEKLRKALRGGCMTAIVSPEGAHVVPPLTQGEGIVVADLDMGLITKRKRMMDSVGHYARPELLHLVLDNRPAHAHGNCAGAGAVCRPALQERANGSASDEADDTQSHADRAADQRVAVLRGSAR